MSAEFCRRETAQRLALQRRQVAFTWSQWNTKSAGELP
jgi:hypothetical protein